MFEVNIRYIGGLLSAFYLTGEEVSWPLEAPGSSWLKRAWENTNPTPSFYEETGVPGDPHPLSIGPPADSSSSSVQRVHSAAQNWLPRLVVNL